MNLLASTAKPYVMLDSGGIHIVNAWANQNEITLVQLKKMTRATKLPLSPSY